MGWFKRTKSIESIHSEDEGESKTTYKLQFPRSDNQSADTISTNDETKSKKINKLQQAMAVVASKNRTFLSTKQKRRLKKHERRVLEEKKEAKADRIQALLEQSRAHKSRPEKGVNGRLMGQVG